MKTYDRAPDEVQNRVIALIRRYYLDLEKVGLRVDLLMASTDTEDAHAVTLGGYPCLAVVRIIGAKDRAKELGDAEIVIDRDAYEAMTEAQRDALLDHELYHLELVKGKTGQPKLDDHRRPKLKMRKHDRQIGWFDEIARRHKENSCEVRQATELFEEASQTYFGFAMDGGTSAEIEFQKSDERPVSPARRFVDNIQKSGMSVTIRAGGESVNIDAAGVHRIEDGKDGRAINAAATIDDTADVIVVRVDGDERTQVVRRDGKFVLETVCDQFRSKKPYDTEAEALEAFNDSAAA